jgi:hypothetical protein
MAALTARWGAPVAVAGFAAATALVLLLRTGSRRLRAL